MAHGRCSKIISMMKWTQTRRLSIKISLSLKVSPAGPAQDVQCSNVAAPGENLRDERCLAHKKQHPPRTLQEAYAWSPAVALGGGTDLMSIKGFGVW